MGVFHRPQSAVVGLDQDGTLRIERRKLYAVRQEPTPPGIVVSVPVEVFEHRDDRLEGGQGPAQFTSGFRGRRKPAHMDKTGTQFSRRLFALGRRPPGKKVVGQKEWRLILLMVKSGQSDIFDPMLKTEGRYSGRPGTPDQQMRPLMRRQTAFREGHDSPHAVERRRGAADQGVATMDGRLYSAIAKLLTDPGTPPVKPA